MRIRKIEVRNFRNLRRVTVRPGDVTVVFGENGSGKSNLLHALRLLFDPEAKRLEADLTEEDINAEALADGERWFRVRVELGRVEKHLELEAVFVEVIDRDGDEEFVTIEGRFEEDAQHDLGWSVRVLRPAGRAGDPFPFSGRMAKMLPLYYLGALRDAERESRAGGRGLLGRLVEDIDLEDVRDEVLKHVQAANQAVSKSTDVVGLADALTRLVTPHLPRGEGSVDLTVAPEDAARLSKALRLSVKSGGAPGGLDLGRQAMGLQNVVLIALFRHLLSKQPTSVPMLAIEEPEAHLHPHAQRRLYDDLAALSGPVLLTTHSPTVVERVDPRALVRMSLTSTGRVRTHQISRDDLDERLLRDMALFLRSGRAEALFARAVVIVEGPSEAVALPVFAEVLGHDLDRDGVSILPSEGNRFGYVLRALSSENLGVPHVVVFDTDALETDAAVVAEAQRAGLIEDDDLRRLRKASPQDRRSALEALGWIPVPRNFEQVVARRSAYRADVLRVIRRRGLTRALDGHMKAKGLKRNSDGIARFLTRTRGGKHLKVAVARAVASAARRRRQVPRCYRRALRRAVRKAVGPPRKP